jgi:hypothetical protein
MSAPQVKVRSQRLSDGSFVCVLAFFGLGESGSDWCALAALQSRKSRKIKAHVTDEMLRRGGWSPIRDYGRMR